MHPDWTRLARDIESAADRSVLLDAQLGQQRHLDQVLAETRHALSARQASFADAVAQCIASITRQAVRGLEELEERLRSSLPPNWQELDASDLDAALDLVQGGRYPLIWAPSGVLLQRLVRATSDVERDEILVADRALLISAARRLLKAEPLDFYRGQAAARAFAGQALSAAAGGLDLAAQAAAAAGLGTVIHLTLGHERLGLAFKSLSRHVIGETEMSQTRVVALQLATANALVDVNRDPFGFNRHGTQHGEPRFYDEVSMISSLLLLAAWIRELDWQARHEAGDS